ncbi:drug/metabolite-transporting permease [Flavobacterium sp. LS1P28]|uniref:Drug/metabolite-transporting permease n=1 Tax=Flavobacterium bomense TaxID=2497483 RepID=A0A3S0PKM5_9FLAO|nr:drug/metabolite-transporting permease [Flavobacterium sp. LB2P53]RTY76891.1 drug/metabolite-transporting permease [Flavobacterium sp. LS1R10]RTY85415.1 drug/metabolite-transporting permease [Flavobacterium sp. LS1P28]RTY93332.1 drug/metabolite-transporting permease [Flavobacterium sp. RSP46]RTZ08276.1 drug/metabolite-transporting permease [Flavobacterium bomense]RTZ09387.1 drug/metabolite-transporting permease [Flavobacterium sp. GSP6]
MPILALCWVSFFWGTTWIASKEGVKHMPALQLVAIRQFLGGFLYISYFLFKKAPWPKGKQWKTIIILSILNFVLSNGLSTWGVKYISSGLGAIIGACVPLWIVIITFFRGERLSRVSVVGLIISFSGVCVIFYDHLSDFLIPSFRFGIIISIISTLTWAFGTLYTKKKAATFNPYFSLGLQMFISSILVFAYTGATGISVKLSEIPAASWWSIAYLVVFGSILTFIAFIYALQNLPAEISSVYSYINPIIAVILGAIIFGETLNTAIAVGGGVTLFGLYLVNYSLRRTRKNSIKTE